jgi:hypothetical protein
MAPTNRRYDKTPPNLPEQFALQIPEELPRIERDRDGEKRGEQIQKKAQER